MNQGIKIRPYNAIDRRACIEIFKSNLPFYFDPSESKYLENWLNAKDKGNQAYPDNLAEYFYVLEFEGDIVACGGFYISGNGKTANIVWGMVQNSVHKKGFGKKLLEHRINLIKESYPAALVTLDTTQHTFRFFESLGFSVLKITENSYGQDLHRYDMILT